MAPTQIPPRIMWCSSTLSMAATAAGPAAGGTSECVIVAPATIDMTYNV